MSRHHYQNHFRFQSPFNFIALVIVTSIVLDLPRFFHFELVDHQTEYWTSKLMENPVYVRYRKTRS